MAERIAIVGVGRSTLAPRQLEYSYRDLIYAAVVAAEQDADLRNDQIPSVVMTGEDFSDGRAIADEFTVDPCGGMRKPNDRICGDSLYGLLTGVMQIKAGLFDLVLAVGYQKPSEIVNYGYLTSLALDPIIERTLPEHPFYIPGVEMRRYLHTFGLSPEDTAAVVVQHRRNALQNASACFGANLTAAEVLHADPLCEPLRALDAAPLVDGAVAVILATESRARELPNRPIWIDGVGWASDGATQHWFLAPLDRVDYLADAARRAYRMAGIDDPRRAIQLVEVDDRFGYKALQHLEALGLAEPGKARSLYGTAVPFAINPSGGLLGMGCPEAATGMLLAAEAAQQLRGAAGGHQVDGARRAVVGSWFGLPARSGGVAVLSNE